MPRKMIDKRLREDFPGHFFDITIFAPRGEEVAKKPIIKILESREEFLL